MYSLVFHTNLTPVEYSGKVPSPWQAFEQIYKEAKIGLKKLALHGLIIPVPRGVIILNRSIRHERGQECRVTQVKKLILMSFDATVLHI
jgi:hypothetical protein